MCACLCVLVYQSKGFQINAFNSKHTISLCVRVCTSVCVGEANFTISLCVRVCTSVCVGEANFTISLCVRVCTSVCVGEANFTILCLRVCTSVCVGEARAQGRWQAPQVARGGLQASGHAAGDLHTGNCEYFN